MRLKPFYLTTCTRLQTDRRTDRVIPVYPPNFVAGSIIKDILVQWMKSCHTENKTEYESPTFFPLLVEWIWPMMKFFKSTCRSNFTVKVWWRKMLVLSESLVTRNTYAKHLIFQYKWKMFFFKCKSKVTWLRICMKSERYCHKESICQN